MKTNRSMKVAIIVIALTLITSCLVGTTFAKYTSSANGTAQAQVAAWSFLVDGEDIVTTDSFTIDLFATINEADGTTAEEDVAATYIAPGTGGSVTFEVENTSEVSADYTISFAVAKTNAGENTIPLEFKLGTGEWKTADQIATLNVTDGSIALADAATPVEYTLYWRWALGDGNANDTALGALAATGTRPTFDVTVSFTATQAD